MNPELAAESRTDAAASAPRGSAQRSLLRRLILALAGAFIVIAGLAALDASRAGAELRAGRAQLRALSRSSTAFATNGSARIARVAQRFAVARARASESPWLGIVSRLGYVGRPARWVRHATAAAASLGTHATAATRRVEARLEGAAASGAPGRLELLATIEGELLELDAALRRARVPDPGWMYPPARGAHRSLIDTLQGVRRATSDGRVAARGLRTFLTGPSRYLVLAGNNAEMRSGGMVLQVGVLRASGGRLEASGFAATSALLLPSPVPVPEEMARLYSWLDPGREWRNTSSSPNFPAVAPLFATMAESAGIGPVDGVLFIDVVALRELLKSVGPIEVGGVRYDADNVERLVLHDLYVRFEGEQRERKGELARLAGEVFRSFDRGVRVGEFAARLADAAGGRHLLAWSRRGTEQDAWRRLRVDGSLERDGLLVTVQNHGGGKLDWFVRPSVSVSVEDRPGGWRRLRLRIQVHNSTPDGEPPYVVGKGEPPGTYRALVAAYLPGWATNVEISPGPVVAVGPDGPMRAIGVRVDVPRQETTTVEVSFSAPPGHERLVLLPSGRATPLMYRFAGLEANDGRRRNVPIRAGAA